MNLNVAYYIKRIKNAMTRKKRNFALLTNCTLMEDLTAGKYIILNFCDKL